MRMTTTNTTTTPRSGARQHQVASTQTYPELPNPSLYRRLPHEVTKLAGSFAELLVAAHFLSSIQLQNYWFRAGEMQI